MFMPRMVGTRLLLICFAAALCGASLHAQLASPEIEIEFLVPEPEEAYAEVFREENDGPWVIAIPFAVKIVFADRTRKDAFNRTIEKNLTLLADEALIWFEAGPGVEVDTDDPFAALSKGTKHFQFYGAGNVWMQYGKGSEAITVRASEVYLDFTLVRSAEEVIRTINQLDKDDDGKISKEEATDLLKARFDSIDANKDGKLSSDELQQRSFSLTGRMSEPRMHSGADENDTHTKLPVSPGIGVGASADEPTEDEPPERVGPAPSDDAIPEPAGTPRSLPQERGARLFARARELRLLSFTDELQEIQLTGGSISSSSLAVASYSLYSESLTLRVKKVRRTAYVTRPSIRVLDFELLALPVENYSYDLDSQFPIRQLEFINSQRFGLAIRSYVDVISTYDFFVDPEPPFRPLQLGPQVDYFTKRGLGLGVNLDWGGVSSFNRFARASMRSIGIEDPGDDRPRARELGWYPVEKHGRGRLLGMYSQYFGGGWQLDHMLNYDTDRNFRREFYEPEYDRNDPIDTYIRLTRRDGALNYYLHFEPRVHPWQSKTEYLPTLGFDAQRAAVGDFGLQLSSQTTASILRFSPGEGDQRNPTYVPRFDTNTWFNLPFELGPFAVDPFVGARFTLANHFLRIPDTSDRPGLAADGTYPGLRASDEETWGILYRFLPVFGVHMQTFFTGTFPDVQIPALGISGLRHVFAPFVRYVNVAYNSLDDIPDRAFIPLDVIDVLDEFHEIRVGFRNRLQTRQGKDEKRRTVDYFEVMTEIPIYPQRRRDNNGRTFGNLEIAAVWRPAPRFALAGNMFIDIYTGNVERASAEFRFNILEFGQANIYYRLLKHQHQVVGIQLDLTYSDAYRINIKQEFDLETGRFRDTRIELHRVVLEAFDLGFIFVRDAVDGDVGFYASISATFRSPRGSSALLR